MKERPILFSGAMVRAILDGRKTQTRRAVRIEAPSDATSAGVISSGTTHHGLWWWLTGDPRDAYTWSTTGEEFRCPYGVPGDRLWVRESGWERPERTPRMMREGADTWARYYYDADGGEADDLRQWGFRRRPSIHMPRWACRIVLEVTGVRVERLHDITEGDATAEGADKMAARVPTDRDAYRYIWDAINGSWARNPWVWVVEFRRAA